MATAGISRQKCAKGVARIEERLDRRAGTRPVGWLEGLRLLPERHRRHEQERQWCSVRATPMRSCVHPPFCMRCHRFSPRRVVTRSQCYFRRSYRVGGTLLPGSALLGTGPPPNGPGALSAQDAPLACLLNASDHRALGHAALLGVDAGVAAPDGEVLPNHFLQKFVGMPGLPGWRNLGCVGKPSITYSRQWASIHAAGSWGTVRRTGSTNVAHRKKRCRKIASRPGLIEAGFDDLRHVVRIAVATFDTFSRLRGLGR